MANGPAILELDELSGALTRIESALGAATTTDDGYLTELVSHLASAGGKRMRPMMAMAAAAAGKPGTAIADEVVLGGVSVELVHIGSLYHDDVMDEAETRRGIESVNHRWGNLRAILAGDFLLGKASEIAASLGTEVAQLLAATIGQLCQGQILELQDAFNLERTEERYAASIEGKTASLFATACRIGGIVAGHDRDVIDALTTYGRNYGMAFQIVDDVLDLIATDDQLGKPSGNDLMEGVYTLPVLRAARLEGGERLADLLGGPIDVESRDTARSFIRDSGAIDDALAEARSYAAAAGDALGPTLRGSETANALASTSLQLIDQVLALG